MLANVYCKKCGETGKFDVGPDIKTVKDAQAAIEDAHIQSCPFGNHVELSDIEYEVLGMEEGEARSDEDVLAEMAEQGRITWTDTGEMQDAGVEITAFVYGFPIANIGGQDFTLSFTSLPSGKRVYYGNREEYERLAA
jgi:hypothetical protein